jgi:hypothetical protein
LTELLESLIYLKWPYSLNWAWGFPGTPSSRTPPTPTVQPHVSLYSKPPIPVHLSTQMTPLWLVKQMKSDDTLVPF